MLIYFLSLGFVTYSLRAVPNRVQMERVKKAEIVTPVVHKKMSDILPAIEPRKAL